MNVIMEHTHMQRTLAAVGMTAIVCSQLYLVENSAAAERHDSLAHRSAYFAHAPITGKENPVLAGDTSDFTDDFAIPNWTLVNTPPEVSGNFNTNPGPPIELYVDGGDVGTGGNTDFQIMIPENGVITFDWGYETTDSDCFDSGGYAINDVYTVLACNADAVPMFSAQAIVPVSQGELFAFRVFTDDGIFGAGRLGVTNFQFQALGDPEIGIAPGVIAFSLEQNQSGSSPMTISNLGGGSLAWTITPAQDTGPNACAAPQAVVWLSTTPAMGNTVNGSDSIVQVLADATGLAVGNHEALLCVDSNDGVGNQQLSIPVSLEVVPGDCIFADGFEEGGDGSCPGGPVGVPGVYDNRDDFLANVLGGHYEEDFATVPVGAAGPSLDFSGEGFAYTVSAVGGGSNNLFNDPGIVSHDSAVDALRITFTGAPVTAVGGNFWGTDVNFLPNGGEITVTLDDGTTEVYTSTGPTNFLGFVTETPILHVTIDAADLPVNSWATMDNLIVGER